MGKIVITVKDESKLELLKNFLESVDYVNSIEELSTGIKTEINIHQATYNRYVRMMNMCWEFNEVKYPNKKIREKYPELTASGKKVSLVDVELGNARKILNYLFQEMGIPKFNEGEDIIDHLQDYELEIIERVKRGHVSFDSIAQALKEKNKYSEIWEVCPEEIISLIDQKIEDEKIDTEKIHPGYTILSKNELVDYFKQINIYLNKQYDD